MADRPAPRRTRRPSHVVRRLRLWWRTHPRLTRSLLLIFIFVAGVAGGLAYSAWTLVCRGGACPSVEGLADFTPDQTSKLYGADGRFIAELGAERRTLVGLADIPPAVQQAFIVTEDKRFYQHAGIDWIRVAGAVLRNLRAGGYEQGFSTITMQLARNLFPERISREKTLTRKLKEAKVARALEARYPKSTILELYLNQIYLGNGSYGVETAAQRYFGKSVRALNVAEAATLAALPKAPERYNPRRSPERAIQRRNTVIALMRRQRVISAQQARLASAYPLRLARRENAGDRAPYFVEWVRQQLEDRFGQRLYRDGLKVYTTLDADMQGAAERALEGQLRAIEGGKFGRYTRTTYEEYLARSASGEGDASASSPYLQGAFVALDPRTGAVRAMIGGRDFDDSKFNRATQALRQPGSTFKPVVYSEAVREGRAPSYLVDDAPVAVPQADGSLWTPQNFDGKGLGTIPMRKGLYLSRNLATVNLGLELGPTNVVAMARRMGLTSPIPAYPSIFLGAADVYPIELIAAYTTFAGLGVRAQPFGIERVVDQQGRVLYQATPARFQVLTPEEAWLMVNMMEDVVRRGTAYRSVWAADFRVPAGGKTGTTNDGTNVWFIGYTPELVAGVWMGFDQPKNIKANAQGGILAAPAWTAFMKEVYRARPAPAEWTRPEGIVAREIDITTGQLANQFCPPDVVTTAYFIAGTEPLRECSAHSPFTIGVPGDTSARPRADSARTVPDPFRIP